MTKRPFVLNFSASDSAGLAGMAMDVRAQTAMGVHSLSVVTANTAQNNAALLAINPVSPEAFGDQLEAVAGLSIQAVKAGLLASPGQCHAIADWLSTISLPFVLDPVLGSSSGGSFMSSGTIDVLCASLFPHTTLLTPNTIEAEKLTGCSINSNDDIVIAANHLLSMGVKAVLIKGGHGTFSERTDSENAIVADYFSDGIRSFWLTSDKVNTASQRGTGCALASAITSAIAMGYSLYDAVVIGKMAISQGLRQSYSVNKPDEEAYGPVNITHFPNEQGDLPCLSFSPLTKSLSAPFPNCNEPLLGLYPVVERAHWIADLAASGISTIQLRVKDLEGQALRQELIEATRLAQQHQMRLFINDYWQLAIELGAYGVHLGQEDLDDADINQIHQAGLRLGISTHCHYEVARAHTYRPSYIACGPVYHTNTKTMPWIPHGLHGLTYWRQVLDYPLVAIGGINQQRFEDVAVTGVDSIAMITAITLADKPLDAASGFVNYFNKNKELVCKPNVACEVALNKQ